MGQQLIIDDIKIGNLIKYVGIEMPILIWQISGNTNNITLDTMIVCRIQDRTLSDPCFPISIKELLDNDDFSHYDLG